MPAVNNLVKQLSVSTGTGNLTLSVATGGYQPFSVFGTGSTPLNVFYYYIINTIATEWEYGMAHMSDTTTLVRDTVIKSSNANSLVNFSAGTKNVVCDIPAQYQLDSSQNNTLNGNLVISGTQGSLVNLTIPGNTVSLFGTLLNYITNVSISPDGTKMALRSYKNGNRGYIYDITTSTLKQGVVLTSSVGEMPGPIAWSDDSSTCYFVSNGDIDVFNTSTGAKTATFSFPGELFFTVLIHGSIIYLGSYGIGLRKANLADFSIIDTLTSPGPITQQYQMVFTPDFSHIYLATPGGSGNTMCVVETAGFTVSATTVLTFNLLFSAMMPNGTFAFMGTDQGLLYKINTTTNLSVANITVTGIKSIWATNTKLYVFRDNQEVDIVDIATMMLDTSIFIGTFPYDTFFYGSVFYIAANVAGTFRKLYVDQLQDDGTSSVAQIGGDVRIPFWARYLVGDAVVLTNPLSQDLDANNNNINNLNEIRPGSNSIASISARTLKNNSGSTMMDWSGDDMNIFPPGNVNVGNLSVNGFINSSAGDGNLAVGGGIQSGVANSIAHGGQVYASNSAVLSTGQVYGSNSMSFNGIVNNINAAAFGYVTTSADYSFTFGDNFENTTTHSVEMGFGSATFHLEDSKVILNSVNGLEDGAFIFDAQNSGSSIFSVGVDADGGLANMNGVFNIVRDQSTMLTFDNSSVGVSASISLNDESWSFSSAGGIAQFDTAAVYGNALNFGAGNFSVNDTGSAFQIGPAFSGNGIYYNAGTEFSFEATVLPMVMGDTQGAGNGTQLVVNDAAQVVSLNRDFQLGGAFKDSVNSSGSVDDLMTSTSSGTRWRTKAYLGLTAVVTSGDLTARTTAQSSVMSSYTTPNDATTRTFRVNAYAAITAISAGTLTVQVSFTDENNTVRTLSYFAMGLTSAGLTTTGFDSFPPAVIRCKANTAITLLTTFTGVSVTYDVGGFAELIY